MQNQVFRVAASAAFISTIFLLTGCGQSTPAAAPTLATAPTAMTQTAMKPTPMKPMSLPTTEPVALKFNDSSIKAIQAGTKTATVRKGVRVFPATVRAIGPTGNIIMLDGVTTTTKKLSDLTEADAKANGSASLDELKTQLVKDYAGIKIDDTVTVVAFKLNAK